ncbi:aminoglycoside N(3)-acetyltransferase [Merdibacter massiliensis]|uniref:aminoglycoside N(3)-acetyltransferase n=1 Tax=Merdibacter massiliensis TaxID=1871030 RepID=UPI00096A4101|nr:AAC(3) family N-acetyltransferase [Merdibacter massiliensis]
MKNYTVDTDKAKSPLLTKEELIKELRLIGLSRGMVLLVEVDSERLPYVVGGEQALIEALMEIVGYEGTIITPAFTPELLDPASVENCPFPYDSWEEIRRNALPYHPKLSIPAQGDPFVQQFLRNDGVVRSNHPLYSFAAWGKYAKVICRRHPLHFALNEESPLGRLEELNGYVLLLGSSFEQASIHALAKYRSHFLPVCIRRLPLEKNTSLFWKDVLDYRMNTEKLDQVQEMMEERKTISYSYLGYARITFFSAHEANSVAGICYHSQQSD